MQPTTKQSTQKHRDHYISQFTQQKMTK